MSEHNAHNARYGWPHRRLRQRVGRDVAAGRACCRRCHQPIIPGQPWDLGHDDLDPSAPAAPEHRRCNRATAGRGAAEVAAERAARTTPPTVTGDTDAVWVRDPDLESWGDRWGSRHWGGSDTYEEWCSECRRQGSACGTVRTTNKEAQ